jgi:long-chain acyl-CoA synthetase
MTLNLAECFFQVARQQADHPLILGRELDDETSYHEFQAKIELIATRLRDAGIKQGDNIGLHYPSGCGYIAFVYAVWSCGGCVTPLPLELTVPEKQQIFQYIHLDAVICDTRRLDPLNTSITRNIVPLTDQAVLAWVESTCETPPQLADVNAAFIRFTSGTTGDAKGVVLSHESIYERIHAANKVLEIGSRDRILWLLSMDYHFAVSIVAYLTFGASIILPQNSFGITLLTAASRHRATLVYGSPTHYALMTQDETGADLPSELRLVIVTTTALSEDTATHFHRRFGRVLNETYGIIELGLPAINISQSREKQGSVGQIVPDYTLRLDCPPGQSHGEITIKGKGMLDAYYSPWRSRDTILRENGGWFRTGDLGRVDSDGFLYIVGRSKEMISVGGMKFFPEEVESVLEKHPAIQAACVFGVREKSAWAEPAQAHVVLKDGEPLPGDDELKTYCRQYLASHKIPSRFVWVERLAYTASGKKIRAEARLRHF